MIKGTKFLSNFYFFCALLSLIFPEKTIFILRSLFNKGNLLLINLFQSGSQRLNLVKNEVTLKSILTLGCSAVSQEILATSENSLLVKFITSSYQIFLIFITSNFELSICAT